MEKEQLCAQALRFFLVGNDRSHALLEKVRDVCEEEEWKRIYQSFLRELLFYQQPWNRTKQTEFERELLPGQKIRIFWTKNESVYTAQATVRFLVQENYVSVFLREDVEEAGMRLNDTLRIPLFQNNKDFEMKGNCVAPVFREGGCL